MLGSRPSAFQTIAGPTPHSHSTSVFVQAGDTQIQLKRDQAKTAGYQCVLWNHLETMLLYTGNSRGRWQKMESADSGVCKTWRSVAQLPSCIMLEAAPRMTPCKSSIFSGKCRQFSLKISRLDTCHQSLLAVNLVTSNCQDQGQNPGHSSRMSGVPLGPHPDLGEKQNSGVEIFFGPHPHLEEKQNSRIAMFREAQTRVATVIKWRREMLASKLFWMYLKSANFLIIDINIALHLKIWFKI